MRLSDLKENDVFRFYGGALCFSYRFTGITDKQAHHIYAQPGQKVYTYDRLESNVASGKTGMYSISNCRVVKLAR